MDTGPFEIERKFLIRYPDLEWLNTVAESSVITQTYLLSEAGISARVRKRVWADRCVYTHTVKRKISNVRRVEVESEILEGEYAHLLMQADPQRMQLHKTRYCMPYHGQNVEIDLFPFWNDRGFLEIELENEGQPVYIPPQIEVIREVTDDKHYTNAALALTIPQENI